MKLIQVILARILTFIVFPFLVLLILVAGAVMTALATIAFLIVALLVWVLIPFAPLKTKTVISEVEDVIARAQVRR